MKLCKDCFYYEPPIVSGDDVEKYSRCTAVRTRSSVTGEILVEIKYCDLTRHKYGECGVDAKLYHELEPREMWQRDEPQGVTNWDTGWNAVYSEQEGQHG